MTTRGTSERFRTIPLRFDSQNEPHLQIGRTEVPLTPYIGPGGVELRVEHLWERLWPVR